MKKIFLSILSIVYIFQASCMVYAQATTVTQSGLTTLVQKVIPKAGGTGTGTVNYISIAKEIQYWIFGLVGFIAVVYIIWVGAKLLWAPGNMEEVSSAMKSLGYILL